MSIITILFIAWVLFYAYRGFKKGLWPMVLGLVGFVGAYVVSILWASGFAGLLQTLGLSSVAAMVTAIVLLFFCTSFLLSTLPQIVFAAKFRERQFKLPFLGAGLGALVGIVSGLVLIWCYSLVKSTLIEQKGAGVEQEPFAAPSALEEPVKDAQGDVLPKLASEFVGGVAAAGIEAIGADNMQTKALGAMLQEPDAFVGSVKSLSRSSELKDFINDRNVQYLMAINDVSSLMRTDAFKKLRDQEGMDRLIGLVESDGKDARPEQMDRAVAENFTFVWRRMQYMKNDPRVQEILRDPEVQKLIQQQNPTALMVNPKVHRLIGLIMQDQPGIENYDFTQLVGTAVGVEVAPSSSGASGNGQAMEPSVPPPPPEPDRIYKWYDDSGRVQYTDEKRVPHDKLDSAELMTR